MRLHVQQASETVVKRIPCAAIIAVTMACITIASGPGLVAAATVPSTHPFATCMATKPKYEVTTSKESKEIRAEINKLFQEVTCRLGDLSRAVNKQEKLTAAKEKDATQLRNTTRVAFERCLSKVKLSEGDWYRKYRSASSGPCVAERTASQKAFDAYVRVSPHAKPWTEHDNWLRALRKFYNLATVYPDAVKPSVLASMIEPGRTAGACLLSGDWCYNG
jgi:hypothetical protein